MIFYTSDTHYGHENILSYSNRPFKTIELMNEYLIQRYNEVVSPTDLCVWVGDCFFTKPERSREIMNQLNGTKVLVRGNHDGTTARMTSLGFSLVCDRMQTRISNKIVHIVHKPETVNSGEFCLHGHLHTGWRRRDNRLHVGVDAWEFRPCSTTELEELIDAPA